MDTEPHSTPQAETFDQDSIDFDPIVASLKLELSPELKHIMTMLKEALLDLNADPESIRLLWIEYAHQFEALAEFTDTPDEHAKVQITAIINKALIFRDTNYELRYLEELDKADMYSANCGLSSLSATISAEIDSRVPNLDETPERLILQLRGRISDANRAQLWELWADEQDYEDLVNHAFEMLLDDGEDPQEVLSDLGILEISIFKHDEGHTSHP